MSTALILLVVDSHSTDLQSRNRFVETALAYALTYATAIDHSKLTPALITILADTDYYSRSGSSASDIPPTEELFLDFNVPLHQAHKTGLGSSAALVTAFTAAVVVHYVSPDLLDVRTKYGRLRVHNLAQAAHCAAQGKVGSGFDVAAAIYGSCVYRRFSPSILQRYGEIGQKGFSSSLKSVIEDASPSEKWDMDIDKGSAMVPKGLRIVMCDVDCGSETVGMVQKVMSWKKTKPEEATLLWQSLQKANEDLALELRSIAHRDSDRPKDYEGLQTIILTMRSLIREMSTQAGVPIEPKVQTILIDACCQLPGVIGGVVPGAGGFDAVAFILEDKIGVLSDLNAFLEKYRVEADLRQGAAIGKVRLLGVKQEDQGIRVEDSKQYQGWLR